MFLVEDQFILTSGLRCWTGHIASY